MWHIFEDPSQTTQPKRIAYHTQGQDVWISSAQGAGYHHKAGTRERKAAAQAQSHTYQSVIQAPMTGRIVQIDVQKDTQVNKSDLLLVLEAMKMEYRLIAPNAGYVETLACKTGDLVHLNDVLITLRPS